MDKWLGPLIAVLFGALLIVIGVVHPGPLWNWDLVTSIRRPLGDTLTSIALVVAGLGVAGGALLKARG